MNKGLLSVVAVVAVVQASVALACSPDGKEGFAPKNDLYIPASKFAVYTISEEDFNDVNTKTQAAYDSVFKSQGLVLKVFGDWENGEANAGALRIGNVAEIHMYGGLARHPKITKDAFQIVFCHELGHHLGGAPRKSRYGSEWASNEGQADYYATFSCARKMWENDENASIISRMDVPSIVKERCTKSFDTSNDVTICIRSAMAGKVLGDVLADLDIINKPGDTDFNTPDLRVVSRTVEKHPPAQCRTDTYFAAAVCEKTPKDILSSTDTTADVCSSERKDEVGVRPLCWYKPSVKDSAPTPEEGGRSSWPSLKVARRVLSSANR